MGVPGLFKHIFDKYSHTVIKVTDTYFSSKKIVKIDHLGIDLNATIHPYTQAAYGPIKKPWGAPSLSNSVKRTKKRVFPPLEKVFNDITNSIDEKVKTFQPRKTLILAMDGVAGCAKQTQQRIRRFKSAKDSIEKKDLEEKSNFDSNCISTGTKFMIDLSEHIKKFAFEKIKSGEWNFKVVFSSDRVPGEGEHKIIKLMKLLFKKNPIDSFLIHSPDADLIMLGMGSHIPNIFIARTNEMGFDKSIKYLMIDIFELKKILLNLMINTSNENIFEKKLSFGYNVEIKDEERLVNDFVFINFFFGNDFFQRIPTMEINNLNMAVLLKVYQKFSISLKGPSVFLIDSNKNIIYKNFFKFIKKLALEEENMLANRSIGSIDHCLTITTPEGDRSKNVPLKKYAENYLLVKLSIDVNTAEGRLELSELCSEYIKAITFVAKYYLDSMPDWHYFFSYHYSPFIFHLEDFLSNTPKIEEIKFELHKPFTPYAQLLSILPPSSKNLLPERFHKLFESDSIIKDFYPINFIVDEQGKKHSYEAISILPFIDVERLLYAYNKIQGKDYIEIEDTVFVISPKVTEVEHSKI